MSAAAPESDAWQTAYARQAKSDWKTRRILIQAADSDLCQQLHYLQMACEKLSKAHLIGAGSSPEEVRTTHRAASKSLPTIIRQLLALPQYRAIPSPQKVHLMQKVTSFAREVELLSPAVNDSGNRPDNCEYPWIDAAGTVWSPLDYNFPHMGLLTQESGRTILKLLDHAIDALPD